VTLAAADCGRIVSRLGHVVASGAVASACARPIAWDRMSTAIEQADSERVARGSRAKLIAVHAEHRAGSARHATQAGLRMAHAQRGTIAPALSMVLSGMGQSVALS